VRDFGGRERRVGGLGSDATRPQVAGV